MAPEAWPMRKIGLCLLLLLSPSLVQAKPLEAASEQAGVASSDNVVKMRLAGSTGWKPCSVGDMLAPGDSIQTGEKSAASLLLSDQTMLRLGPNTEIKIVSLKPLPSGLTERFLMSAGRAWARVTPGADFQLQGPNAVAAVKGTILEMDCTKKNTTVKVWQGTVQCAAGNQTFELCKDRSVVADARSAHPGTCSLDSKDSWQSWNMACDQQMQVAFNDPPGGIHDNIKLEVTSTAAMRTVEKKQAYKPRIALSRKVLSQFNKSMARPKF